MAFAKQYFSSYKSNNNLDYYLEIWVDGFDSSATEISVGAGGPVISYETDQEDRFSPILSSQCVLPFVVKNTTLQAFIQQLRTTYKERQVYLHLYRATSSTYTTTKPIWSGFLVMDLGSGEDVSFPYEQKLTFVDGLSLLKDIDFVDLSDTSTPPGDTIPLNERIQGNYDRLNMYYGPAIYTFWIKEILAKAGIAISGVNGQGVSIDYGFTTAVNWYNADMQNTNQGSDPLGLTQCVVSMFHNKNDQDVFTPENCYTVLKELLRHWGARITYWKHEFWIVQIPEYIQDESGLIDNPDNINSRQYNRFGTLTGSQDHLGDTYYTRYEQTIQGNQVSKLVGTKYNYLPMIHNAEADFLSFASKNYYGGFPYGVSAESQEIFQGTIIDPSTANFLWLSVPLNWTWDMTGSSLTSHRWWCSVKFNFYASDGTTTYYLQYDSSNGGSYYWVLEADWTPLGNTSPKYVIKSSNLTETNYIGFQESIPFVDSSGSAITMTGAWSFFLDIEDYGSSSSNPGSFFCRFSGYGTSNYIKRNPTSTSPSLPTQTGSTSSGTVSWSNTLENPSGMVVPSFSTPAGFNAGTSQADIQLITTSAFKGLLQTLNTTQTSSFGLSLNTQVNNSTNTEKFSFGTLLWGDAIQQFAVGCLRVNNGSAFVKTNPSGEWGRGTLTGTNTFTELLIDEFLSGQIKVVIAPTMRLAVGEENKNQTATGTGGPATRPRYVNPIGRLREFRSNETDPEYIFRRGSFHSLYDEWDYEGYQILRDTVNSTTTTTDIGDLGGTQDNKPLSNAKIIPNVTDALMLNSPVASIRTTVPATGSNVAVNGNFNTAVGWTLGSGWSIDTTAKKAKFAATGSTSELTQSVLTQGLTYQVNFQVVVTAGTLLVKAGTSGTSLSITTSGDYSFYLDCDGSNLIKFQAGTTFTGNITYITLRDQKSISSVPINSIGSTVFKSGDTFNLINSLGGEILPLTVSSNQGATDDTISVTSTALFDDIGIDSVLLINQDDLSAQYQNKTKGTVAGFGIDADGISKGGIEITGWLNSDTMSGAAVTNVPTALSVKNYVDGQVGASDTLAEVLANGNTTGGTDIVVSANDDIVLNSLGTTYSKLVGSENTGKYFALENSSGFGEWSSFLGFVFKTVVGNTERMRLTTTGLGIGTTSIANKLDVNGNISATTIRIGSNASGEGIIRHNTGGGNGIGITTGALSSSSIGLFVSHSSNNRNVGIGTTSPNRQLQVKKTTGTASIAITSSNTGIAQLELGGTSDNDIAGVTYNGNTSMLSLKTNNTGQLYVTNGGNVLIGTTTDSGEKLQVEGNAKISGLSNYSSDYNLVDINSTKTNGSAVTNVKGINLNVGSNDHIAGYDITNLYGAYINNNTSGGSASVINNWYGIYIPPADSDRVANRVSAYFGDNVGIGTSSPSAKLEAAGNIYINGSNLKVFESSVVNYYHSTKMNSYGTFYDWEFAGSKVMRIKSNGNVLIGTTSDDGSSKLQVAGNALLTGTTFIGDTFTKIQSAGGSLLLSNLSSSGAIKFRTNSVDVAQITSGGNLLIGTTTDQDASGSANFKLQVNGHIIPTVNNTYELGNPSYRYLKVWAKLIYDINNGRGTTNQILTSTGAAGIAWADASTVIGGPYLPLTGGTLTGELTGTTATFSGQVTIPATPVASTDAASKSYVDAQVSATDSLQEVTTIGNTTTNSVMIGSSADPDVTLHIDDTVKIGDRTGNNGSLILQSQGGPTATLSQSGDVLNLSGSTGAATGQAFIFNNDFNRIEFANSVGGTIKINRANVGSLSTNKGGINIQQQDSTASNGKATFLSNDTNGVLLRSTSYGGAGSAGNILFQFGGGDAGATVEEKMRLTSGGNLLIGTTTDSGAKLDVSGVDNGVFFRRNTGQYFKFTTDAHSNRFESAGKTVFLGTTDAQTLYLKTNDSSRLTITSGGNVLIGTTTDNGEKLQVEGSVIIRPSGQTYYNEIIPSSNISSYSNTSQSQQSGIVTAANNGTFKSRNVYTGTNIGSFNPNGTVYVGAFSYGNVNYITGHNAYDHVFKQNNSTTLMTIKGGGNVLIGTTTDSGVYRLDVSGKARVQSVFELDDVLTLNQISTPADPASGKSSIYMDSADGAIKVKINVGGTVVTRTIASFE